MFIFSAIDANEKLEIKRTLLAQSFQEPVPQIAVQLAVLIGNIARIDYPREWSEVCITYTVINLLYWVIVYQLLLFRSCRYVQASFIINSWIAKLDLSNFVEKRVLII